MDAGSLPRFALSSYKPAFSRTVLPPRPVFIVDFWRDKAQRQGAQIRVEFLRGPQFDSWLYLAFAESGNLFPALGHRLH